MSDFVVCSVVNSRATYWTRATRTSEGTSWVLTRPLTRTRCCTAPDVFYSRRRHHHLARVSPSRGLYLAVKFKRLSAPKIVVRCPAAAGARPARHRLPWTRVIPVDRRRTSSVLRRAAQSPTLGLQQDKRSTPSDDRPSAALLTTRVFIIIVIITSTSSRSSSVQLMTMMVMMT